MINQIMINFIQVNCIFWEGILFYLTKDNKHVVERIILVKIQNISSLFEFEPWMCVFIFLWFLFF
jgi:hypothetical protein